MTLWSIPASSPVLIICLTISGKYGLSVTGFEMVFPPSTFSRILSIIFAITLLPTAPEHILRESSNGTLLLISEPSVRVNLDIYIFMNKSLKMGIFNFRTSMNDLPFSETTILYAAYQLMAIRIIMRYQYETNTLLDAINILVVMGRLSCISSNISPNLGKTYITINSITETAKILRNAG